MLFTSWKMGRGDVAQKMSIDELDGCWLPYLVTMRDANRKVSFKFRECSERGAVSGWKKQNPNPHFACRPGAGIATVDPCCGKGDCTPTWGCKLSKSRLFEQLEIQYSTVLDMPAYFQHPTRNAALSYF
jgi:hypothetical protein